VEGAVHGVATDGSPEQAVGAIGHIQQILSE
jgi:hypothetical protein